MAQRALIDAALADGGVTPAAVRYVEAHGTGTALGDPIEMSALGAALAADAAAAARGAPLLVGAVKGNVGHLEGAAGLLGVVKTALVLHHAAVPPNANFEEANPLLADELRPGRLALPLQLTPLPRAPGAPPRAAGVSSFGFGGANAHAVLQEAPPRRAPPTAMVTATERPLLPGYTPRPFPWREAAAAPSSVPGHVRSASQLSTATTCAPSPEVERLTRKRRPRAAAIDVEAGVLRAVRAVLPEVATQASPLRTDESLVSVGLDSLSAVELRNLLVESPRSPFRGLDLSLDALLEAPTVGEIAATLRRLLSSSPDPDDVSSEVIRTLASSAASLCCTCRCEGGGCCDDASCTCSASPSASSPSCCRSAAASNEGSNEVSSSDGEGIDEPHHRECAAPLGASCLQQGMLYLHAAAPQQRTFVESVTWALDGPLDASRFRRAWETVVAATPMLRTRFAPNATPQPLQVVEATAALPFAIDDHSGCEGAAARAAAVDAAVRRERAAGIDLEAAPLLRLRLLRFAPTSHALVLTIHHLVEDGWSLRLIVDMVSRAYSGAALPVGPSYDVKLRHEEEVCAAGGPSELFWREAMRGYAGPPPLLPGAPPPVCSADDAAATRASVVVSAATVRALRGRAAEAGATPASLCHAAWAAVQWATEQSGRDEVVYGCTFSGRSAARAGLGELIGPVLNTAPVRVRVGAEDATAASLIRCVHSELLRRQPHEAYPLARIQQLCADSLAAAASGARPPLFHAIVDYQPASGWGFDLDGGAVVAGAPTIIDRIGTPLSIRFMLQRPPSDGAAELRVTATSEVTRSTHPSSAAPSPPSAPSSTLSPPTASMLLSPPSSPPPAPRRRRARARRSLPSRSPPPPRHRCRRRSCLSSPMAPRAAGRRRRRTARSLLRRWTPSASAASAMVSLPPPPPAPPSPSPSIATSRRAFGIGARCAAAAPSFILEVEAGDRRERSFAEHAARVDGAVRAAAGAAGGAADEALVRFSVGSPPPAEVPTTVFAFHAAGSSAALFAGWAEQLRALSGGAIELVAVDLPGHGSRRAQEAAAAALPELLASVLADVAPRVAGGAPYALFGYSMGALVAYEVAAALTARGTPPRHLLWRRRRHRGRSPPRSTRRRTMRRWLRRLPTSAGYPRSWRRVGPMSGRWCCRCTVLTSSLRRRMIGERCGGRRVQTLRVCGVGVCRR